jgi:OHCU decarboxylase
MAQAWPFSSDAALIENAERIWGELPKCERLEVFASHARIGDSDAIRAKFPATAVLASREQAGALGAPEEVLQDLARGNRQYEERFGHSLASPGVLS